MPITTDAKPGEQSTEPDMRPGRTRLRRRLRGRRLLGRLPATGGLRWRRGRGGARRDSGGISRSSVGAVRLQTLPETRLEATQQPRIEGQIEQPHPPMGEFALFPGWL